MKKTRTEFKQNNSQNQTKCANPDFRSLHPNSTWRRLIETGLLGLFYHILARFIRFRRVSLPPIAIWMTFSKYHGLAEFSLVGAFSSEQEELFLIRQR